MVAPTAPRGLPPFFRAHLTCQHLFPHHHRRFVTIAGLFFVFSQSFTFNSKPARYLRTVISESGRTEYEAAE